MEDFIFLKELRNILRRRAQEPCKMKHSLRYRHHQSYQKALMKHCVVHYSIDSSLVYLDLAIAQLYGST